MGDKSNIRTLTEEEPKICHQKQPSTKLWHSEDIPKRENILQKHSRVNYAISYTYVNNLIWRNCQQPWLKSTHFPLLCALRFIVTPWWMGLHFLSNKTAVGATGTLGLLCAHSVLWITMCRRNFIRDKLPNIIPIEVVLGVAQYAIVKLLSGRSWASTLQTAFLEEKKDNTAYFMVIQNLLMRIIMTKQTTLSNYFTDHSHKVCLNLQLISLNI